MFFAGILPERLPRRNRNGRAGGSGWGAGALAAAISLAPVASVSGPPAPHHVPPLADQICTIINQPLGTRRYLTEYRRVAQFITAHPGSLRHGAPAYAGDRAVLAPVLPDIRRIVRAMAMGAQPTAFRDALLQSLELSADFLPHGGKPWPYGNIGTAMFLESFLTRTARRDWRAGRRRVATRYERAAMVLWAQNDAQLGTPLILSYFLGGAHLTRADKRLLQLQPAAAVKLDALYRASSRLFSRIFTPTSPTMVLRRSLMRLGKKNVRQHMLRAYIGALSHKLRRCSGHLAFVYFTLRGAEATVRGLYANGHKKSARAVGKALTRLNAARLAGAGPKNVATLAVRRWIKEASLWPAPKH